MAAKHAKGEREGERKERTCERGIERERERVREREERGGKRGEKECCILCMQRSVTKLSTNVYRGMHHKTFYGCNCYRIAIS